MIRLTPFVVIGALALSACGTHAAVRRQTPVPGPEQPRVQSRRGTPLASLVKPGQSTLVVEKDQSPPLAVEPPPGVGQLEWLTSLAPVVLIVQVEKIVPALTPAGDWIESTVHAPVEEVLKSAPLTLSPGPAIRFRQDGGRMRIAGTDVRAVLPWTDSFEAGERYLIFAEAVSGPDVFTVNPAASYLISQSGLTLVPLARQGKITSQRGVSLKAATDRIRGAAR